MASVVGQWEDDSPFNRPRNDHLYVPVTVAHLGWLGHVPVRLQQDWLAYVGNYIITYKYNDGQMGRGP